VIERIHESNLRCPGKCDKIDAPKTRPRTTEVTSGAKIEAAAAAQQDSDA
jgi:hypothetical protein